MTCHHSIYAFVEGYVIALRHDNLPLGSLFSLFDGSNYFFTVTDVGFGVVYERLYVDGEQVILDYRGYYRPSQQALDTLWDIFDIRSADYSLLYFFIEFYPFVNFQCEGNRVNVSAFEEIFGARKNRIPIAIHEISEYNIQLVFW